MVSWFLGFKVSWFIGLLISWFLVSWFQSFLASKFQSFKDLQNSHFVFSIDIAFISKVFKILLDGS